MSTTIKARSQHYQAFASYLMFPDKATWQTSLDNQRLLAFEQSQEPLPYAYSQGSIVLGNTLSLDDLNITYTNHFESSTAPISFHGRSYLKIGDQKIFEELFRFYSHFGLDFEKSDNNFWPDSLISELEFMYYLVYLEGLNKDQNNAIIKGQRDFIVRQLLPLVEGIISRLQDQVIPPYSALLKMLLHFTLSERDYLNTRISDRIVISNTLAPQPY